MSNIILLGITSLLTDISSEMVYPLLPVFLVYYLGTTPAILGLIEGVAESLASLVKVFSGYFSDRVRKRRPFTIFGYASSAVGKFILYIAANWLYVFFARAIDRLGKGIRTAPRDALIAESSQKGKRGQAFGLHRAMDTSGATIGVFISYILITRFSHAGGFNPGSGSGNLRNIFLFSLIPAFLGVLFLFFIHEKKTQLRLNSEKLELSSVKLGRFHLAKSWRILDKRLKLFLFFTFIFSLGNSSNQFLLLRARNSGGSLTEVILFYLVYNIVYALITYPAGCISDKMGRKKLLVCGYFFYGLVYLGFAAHNSLGMFWFLFGLYGLYMAFTEGVEKALVVDIAPSELRATLIGLHAAIVGIGLLPASLLAGILWKFFGPAAPFYFGGILGIMASMGLGLALRGL